jgi:hypothetical protein
MPRQLYPGQHTFRISSDDIQKTKQIKRRTDIQRNVVNLRQRHQKNYQNSNIVDETAMVEIAMKRYCINKTSRDLKDFTDF